MSRLSANSLGRDYALGDLTAEEKGLRELVEPYGERLTDADWRYQEFRCKHPVRHDPGTCRTLPLMHDHLQDRPDQAGHQATGRVSTAVPGRHPVHLDLGQRDAPGQAGPGRLAAPTATRSSTWAGSAQTA